MLGEEALSMKSGAFPLHGAVENIHGMAPSQGFNACLDVVIEKLFRDQIVLNPLEHIVRIVLRLCVLTP